MGSDNLVPLDSEMERTLTKIKKDKREIEKLLETPMDNLEGFREEEDVVSRSGESLPPHTPPMAHSTQALRDYALPPVIRRLPIQAIILR